MRVLIGLVVLLGAAHAQAPLPADIDKESLARLPLPPEKDALVIRFGRQLFREKKVSPDIFARTEALFGKRGTVELVALMGDDALVGLLSGAVDRHLPEGKASLPVVH